MTVAGGQIGNAAAASGAAHDRAASDWEAVRHAADIQFTPLPAAKAPAVPHVPEWLKALGRFLEWLFGPLGRFFGMSWPVFQWVLIGLAVLLAAFLLWRLLGPAVAQWLRRRGEEEETAQWAPTRAEAAALLEDADRLAGEGCFGEAVHLLLRRSVGHIRDAQPDWLMPASTAREIAVLPMLPEAGRKAFAAIATRVERSLFALRDLDAQDWAAARAAYADFARVALAS
ncbi:hypothetical protein [Novosphingobium album (ex Hu et al. 2023)]|uniref:DUF4129 domain-containing protein n=1 Tax=Novosphingobium album (ex Hu et al. 2023) TaxID=2930093 RepID=A0ABT0B5S6_9SPHN|nr:hypothetical protein [Novosphingobium album (ex Hu et al. 2023)]MCJ2180427.1 hypothetical protein [Novosphingobium album (ex Hu et al. 2023)]